MNLLTSAARIHFESFTFMIDSLMLRPKIQDLGFSLSFFRQGTYVSLKFDFKGHWEILGNMSKSPTCTFLGCAVVVNVSTLVNNGSLILLVLSKRLICVFKM